MIIKSVKRKKEVDKLQTETKGKKFLNLSFFAALIITLLCSVSGKILSGFPGLNVIGALVIALLMGMIIQVIPDVKSKCSRGIGFISNKFLRAGIIFLGFKLNLVLLAESGIKYLMTAIFIVAVIIMINYYLMHRCFKIDSELSLLAGCGCGICGAAAVIGIGPQLKAKEDNQVLAVAVVAILGTVFTLIDIALYGVLGISRQQYGVIAGGSLHEIAHAVAAGNAISKSAEQIAIITKLSRVLMLAPVAIIAGIYYQKTGEKNKNAKLPVPYFMGGFLLSSIIGSFLPIPHQILQKLVDLAYILLGMAMAALGISVNFKVIKDRGGKVFLAAFIGSGIQLIICIIIAKVFFK